jgi:hypothetical protein
MMPSLLSIGREKTGIGAAGTDENLEGTAASRTPTFISRFVRVDVNPRIHAATGELYPNETLPIFALTGGMILANREIQVFAGHIRNSQAPRKTSKLVYFASLTFARVSCTLREYGVQAEFTLGRIHAFVAKPIAVATFGAYPRPALGFLRTCHHC